MEQTTTTNNEIEKKSAINEVEGYFNSLLKSQSDDNTMSKLRIAKLLSLAILALIVGLGLYLAAGLYINSNNVTSSSNTIESNTENSSGAYFNPEYYLNKERKISGKINKNLGNITDERLRFELSENNGKTIAYLISRNHDLNLSVGLQVEIQGQLTNNAFDGLEIIEVNSIKLK